MKLTQDTSPVEISGAQGKPQEFQIKASKEAFKILSSGLYNNKILAIIRELSCNAYDAHVAAGKKEEPFEVHLPTRLAPTFTVKDNGIGMSHENVLALYTTYFATDKSASNDFVGALGLGSKSPFCYTEGFTVVSRHQGMKRYYSCYIGETGTPTVLMQREEPTDECNGLEVSFPVNKEDCWEFENQACSAFEFFDPLPKTNVDLGVHKKEYLFKTTTWGLRKNAQTGPRAIQGMVPYSVGSIDASRLNKIQAKLISLPLDLFFSIGDLSVTASRESLSNDERTINNILTMFDEIGNNFIDQVKKQLETCENLWDARLMLWNLGNSNGFGGLVQEGINKGAFDGIYPKFTYKATDNKLTIKEFEYAHIQISRFRRSYRGNTNLADKTIISSSAKRREDHLKWETRDSLNLSFNNHERAIFVINDVGFGVERYVHHFVQNTDDFRSSNGQGYEALYFINRFSKEVQMMDVVLSGKKLVEAIGKPPCIKVSELKAKYQEELADSKPDYIYVKRQYIHFSLRANVRNIREGNDGTSYRVQGWRDGWIEAEPPDPTDIKYYVLVKSLVPQKGSFDHAEEFQRFLKDVINSDMFDLDPDTFKLYGLTADSPFLKDNSWVEFTGYIFNKVLSFMNPAKELELSLYIKNFNVDKDLDSIFRQVAAERPLSPTSEFQKFCLELSEARKYDAIAVEALMTVLNKAKELGLYEVENIIDFPAKWKTILPLYPLMAFVDKPYFTEENYNQHIIDYIRMVDDFRARQQPLTILNEEETEHATYSLN